MVFEGSAIDYIMDRIAMPHKKAPTDISLSPPPSSISCTDGDAMDNAETASATAAESSDGRSARHSAGPRAPVPGSPYMWVAYHDSGWKLRKFRGSAAEDEANGFFDECAADKVTAAMYHREDDILRLFAFDEDWETQLRDFICPKTRKRDATQKLQLPLTPCKVEKQPPLSASESAASTQQTPSPSLRPTDTSRRPPSTPKRATAKRRPPAAHPTGAAQGPSPKRTRTIPPPPPPPPLAPEPPSTPESCLSYPQPDPPRPRPASPRAPPAPPATASSPPSPPLACLGGGPDDVPGPEFRVVWHHRGQQFTNHFLSPDAADMHIADLRTHGLSFYLPGPWSQPPLRLEAPAETSKKEIAENHLADLVLKGPPSASEMLYDPPEAAVTQELLKCHLADLGVKSSPSATDKLSDRSEAAFSQAPDPLTALGYFVRFEGDEQGEFKLEFFRGGTALHVAQNRFDVLRDSPAAAIGFGHTANRFHVKDATWRDRLDKYLQLNELGRALGTGTSPL